MVGTSVRCIVELNETSDDRFKARVVFPSCCKMSSLLMRYTAFVYMLLDWNGKIVQNKQNTSIFTAKFSEFIDQRSEGEGESCGFQRQAMGSQK